MGSRIWWLPNIRKLLFGVVKLVKKTNVDRNKYSEYGVAFDRRDASPVANGFDINVIIFGVDMSSSVHVDNKIKIFQFLVKLLHKD